jgi:hypothetical protein
MARVVLEIFLSSTSEDLGDYRIKVGEVLERFRQATLRMESFGARPEAPLTACREQVRSCDVLIVLVGHRYGWIPSEAEGGDGLKSITWWEVEWALEAGKPVYAFLVDPQAAWTGPREQDALAAAATEADGLAVWRAVRSLQRFRHFLERQTTRATFASPDQLASRVATSLVELVVAHEVRQAKATVAAAPLPSPPARPRIDEPAVPFVFETDREQAVVVGSDVVSFVKGIPEGQRQDVVNAMLLAQLVANRKVGEVRELSQVHAWHDEYVDVLENLGFVVRKQGFADHFEGASDLEILDAIREVATSELRATPEAVALLLKTMESLTSMSVDSPIVTLFQRESQSASAARFQMTLVEHDDAGKLRVQILGFGLKSAKTVTQVLFFRSQKNQASLRYVAADATIDAGLLAALREPIAAKLADHTGYIKGFDI